ncbi:MAG: acyl-CoA dehydrogenase, partial [Chloroflexi bacterium]|nr:acyl-CoA dehydrogenase [Chloroflexota bacterium]
DPYAMQTTATREGDAYILTGTKAYVPLADQADVMLVYANEGGVTQAFIVPKDTPGLTVEQREKLMGLRALPTYRVTLDGVKIPAANKLGGEKGVDFERLLAYMRVATAAAAVGVARASFEYARDYAKQRVQFGEPIAHRQSIAFMLAEMAIDIDGLRLMTWEAAWKLDRGEDATREAYLAKLTADDIAVEVTDRGVQILGGYGYIREYPVERWLRNGRGIATFEGLILI